MDQINEAANPSNGGGNGSERSSTPHGDGRGKFERATEGIKENARRLAEEPKQAGAERIEGFSRAVHGAADELGRELPQAADYIHTAADRLESVSSALRDRSIESLVSDFNAFARRQPTAAFAGAVVAGFALSRFIKSTTKS